jgi:hypothetical protein
MRRTTPRGLAALAMLAIGGGQLLAPAAQAGLRLDNGTSMSGMAPDHASPNGANLNGQGLSANGVGLNGTGLQGSGPQGGDPSAREAEAPDLGALALLAVRLPDSRVLPVSRE